MRYFTCFLPSLIKSFIFILPFCSLGGCFFGESDKTKENTFHPCWDLLNLSEGKNNWSKVNTEFTKFTHGTLRFHPADHQKCFNAEIAYLKDENNFIQTDKQNVDWVFTPNFYGTLTVEKFPKTMETGMRYEAYCGQEVHDGQALGIPLSFLEEWLAIDPVDHKDAILILSKGVYRKLGVSQSLDKALKNKKERGEIKDYKILKSQGAMLCHNRLVKNGEKVFTFIHTVG